MHDRAAAPAPALVARVPVLALRHAESEWNRIGRWQGRADPPLSPAGRQHAAEVATRLMDDPDLLATPPVAVWSSPLARAVETARIVAAELGLAVHLDDRLVEHDVGGWQGLTTAEIEQRWPGHLAELRWPVGWERSEVVVARASAALVDVAAAVSEPGGGAPSASSVATRSAVVVAHGGVIRTLLRSTSGGDVHVPNLTGAWFDVTVAAASVRPTRLRGAIPVTDAATTRL